MARATVELDFFGMEKENTSSKSQLRKLFDRQKSFRGIQNAIAKMNPELLKRVVLSGPNPRMNPNSFSVPSSPKEELSFFPTNLPVYTRTVNDKSVTDTAPLTIFYNGTVSVFDVSPDKAECIFKYVAEGCSADQQVAQSSNNQRQQLIRRISLQRFLEKRKERLTSASPYACHTKTAFQ